KWKAPLYRSWTESACFVLQDNVLMVPIYQEHDQKYLEECLENLRVKGIDI
ncbi:TIGR02328 family protein, partial [Streptococcus canis]